MGRQWFRIGFNMRWPCELPRILHTIFFVPSKYKREISAWLNGKNTAELDSYLGVRIAPLLFHWVLRRRLAIKEATIGKYSEG